MKSAAIVAGLCLFTAGVLLGSCPALADDEPISVQADGGSTVTSTDGGSTATVDLSDKPNWTMAIRCVTQPARYRLCAGLPCPVTAANQLLDADRTFDIRVNRTGGIDKRYLTVGTDDGGIPACQVQNNR